MRLLLLLGAALLLAGCPRVYPDGADPAAKVTGSHPWDSPDYKAPEVAPLPGQQQEGSTDRVELPEAHGPALPREDTLSEELIAGHWVQVALAVQERIDMVRPSEQDALEFRPGGYLIYSSRTDWKETRSEGGWKKDEPGQVGISIQGQPFAPYYGQIYRSDFMYLWNYESKSGTWFVRAPEAGTDRILANRFQTNRGELHLRDVVGSTFTGDVTGVRPLKIYGGYQGGVMTLRWEEQDGTGAGYATFIVDADWQELRGVWWIDDYEAAPFSADWDGRAVRSVISAAPVEAAISS